MRSLTFDELFAMLSAVQLSASDLARLREWIAGITHAADCIALTGTPLARLRKKACWLPFLQCVLESRTVRGAARVVGRCAADHRCGGVISLLCPKDRYHARGGEWGSG
jgi:hypothetical protein